MSFFHKVFAHSWKRYLVAVLLAVAIGLLYLFLHSFEGVLFYVDAFGIGGGVTFCIGMLMLVSFLGAFDTFAYAFSTLQSKRQYKDLYEYNNAKEEKRKQSAWGFCPFLLVGLVFVLVSFLIRWIAL